MSEAAITIVDPEQDEYGYIVHGVEREANGNMELRGHLEIRFGQELIAEIYGLDAPETAALLLDALRDAHKREGWRT